MNSLRRPRRWLELIHRRRPILRARIIVRLVLCCALLVSLSVTTDFARAAPLAHVGSPGEVSNAWTQKWLVGKSPTTFGPPEGLTEMQKTEWTIGIIAGLAGVCGHYGKVTEVRAFMNKSPYFRRGHSDIADWEDKLVSERCGERLSTLKEVLGRKEEWEHYLDVTYPIRRSLPEPPEKLSTDEQERPYCSNRVGGQC